MSIFYIFYFILLISISILFIYIGILRKNAFEERLALFSPTRHLSQKREAYRQQVRKYSKYAKIILLVILYLPLCVLIAILIKEGYEGIGILNILSIYDDDIFVYVPILLLNYLLFYVIKRNEKAQHMLLEQMSDGDFEFLLKVKDSLFFISKYNPPFVLCNDKLYIFIFFVIKEIDPAQITDLDWSYRRNGILVEFKAPEKIIFTLPKKVLPYFLQIIEQYTDQEFYY